MYVIVIVLLLGFLSFFYFPFFNNEQLPPLRRRYDLNATILFDGSPMTGQNYSFWAPLPQDRIQLFGFADRIADRESELCISIETALLAGWKYQLIGPTVSIARPPSSSTSSRFDEKALKIFSLSLLMDALPADVIVVFADAMDVLYQRNATEFASELLQSPRFKEGAILYGAEKNCWPFSRTNKKTYHCPLMQGANWKPDGKEPGLACKLQDKVYETYLNKNKISGTSNSNSSSGGIQGSKGNILREERSIYLNSGLSVGVVANYSKLVKKSNEMVNTMPHLCIDDQGLVAWQMVTSDVPTIALDYTSTLLGSLNNRKMKFDNNDGLMKLWRYEQGSAGTAASDSDGSSTVAPFMIHFNGNGKADNLYNRTRDELVQWKIKSGMNVKAFLENEAMLWVDGKPKKFAEVCKNHVHDRVKDLLVL